VTENFVSLGLAMAKNRQRPDIPMVTLPEDVEHLSDAELDLLAVEALDRILASVRTPVTEG
jgi:hypothetical protein